MKPDTINKHSDGYKYLVKKRYKYGDMIPEDVLVKATGDYALVKVLRWCTYAEIGKPFNNPPRRLANKYDLTTLIIGYMMGFFPPEKYDKFRKYINKIEKSTELN